MLLAYEAGASLIVAVGTHATMVEFLDKGRSGMASTFLTRLRLGPVLVDAKGVSKLYEGRVRRLDWVLLVGSALVAIIAVAAISDSRPDAPRRRAPHVARSLVLHHRLARHMINFRFHLVSIVAVFLALAVGVVMGYGVLGQPTVDTLQNRIDTVEANAEARRKENDDLRAALDLANEAADQTSPFSVTDRLTDRAGDGPRGARRRRGRGEPHRRPRAPCRCDCPRGRVARGPVGAPGA